MACKIVTPELKEIAKKLNIPTARVALLAGLCKNKSDNYTVEDIQEQLQSQEESLKGLAKFDYLKEGVIYGNPNETETLVYSDNGVIHINTPSENTGAQIVSYLMGKDKRYNSEKPLMYEASKRIPNTLWNEIQQTVFNKQRGNLFLNYYVMHRIAYNNNFGNRTQEEKELIMSKAILDSFNLFKEWLNYSNQPNSNKAQSTTSFSKSLSQEQRQQFYRLFGPYEEGGGADINELFTQALPEDVSDAITDFIMDEGELLTRDMMKWIVTNLKEENKQYLSSFYPKQSNNNLVSQSSEQNQSLGGFSRQQETQETQSLGGFSRQESVVPVAQEEKFIMPQVNRGYLKASSSNNPIAVFNQTFSALEKKEAVEAIATDFIATIDTLRWKDYNEALQRNEPEKAQMLMQEGEAARRKYITANAVRIIEEQRKSYQDYLNNQAAQQREASKFGQDFVDTKLMYLSKITAPNNFEILMKDAAMAIERIENVAIGYDFKASESNNNESVEQSAEEDSDGDVRDGWMIKVREVDPRLTLSSRVKKAIATIPKGKKEFNVLGKKKLLSPDFVHAVLINEMSNMAYVEDFISEQDGKTIFPVLDNLKTKYPWIINIIRKLESQPELASQFYTDFRKDFISYTETIDVYETDDEGKVVMVTVDGITRPKRKTITKYLNKAVAVDATLSEVLNNYESGNTLNDLSIYELGKVNESNRKKAASKLGEIARIVQDIDFTYENDSDRERVFKGLTELLNAVGLNTQIEDLQALYGDPNFEQEINTIRDKLGVILGANISEGAHLVDYFNDAYTSIAEIVGRVSEVMNIQSFRAGDKMYYSYSPSNYINTMTKRLADNNDERREAYIQKEFKQYEWFYDSKNERWRNGWLELISNNKDVRDHFTIENMNVIEKILEDGTKITIPYREWEQENMAEAFLLQYYSIPNNDKATIQYAKYNTPIYSDSPIVNFVTMPKITGEDYQDKIIEKLIDVVEQELVRIKDIADRQRKFETGELTEHDYIANYDAQGSKFLFFPRLNNIPGFYNTINELYKQGKVDEARAIIANALNDIMTRGAEEFKASNPISVSVAIDNGIITSEEQLDSKLEEYYWNQAYATTQLIQLTTTDLAYYKNGVDFQKRYKEVYAAGNKLNTKSKHGKATEKVLYLKDEKLKSVVLSDITEVLNQAVKEGRITKLDSEAILSKFKKVNVADAQAYRSISSMCSVLDMMGQWTPEMEEAVNKFKEGTWTIKDFSTIWQTLKPFMFTQVQDTSGGTARKVPHQNKNSEFLLLAMHSLVAGSNIGKSPILSTLNEFMEDKGIDVVMFESAVKSGNQGAQKITDGMSKNEVLNVLKNALDIPTAIKEFDYEDYVIQQPTPEHLIDHLGIFGSQFRNLIVSDMSDDAKFTLKINGRDKEFTKAEILKLYQGAIVENLLQDYQKVKGRFANIESLQKALLDSMKGNPKYGSDIVEALQIVDGRFNIPLHNPTITEKIQEVVNSFFKTQITKQKIRGGNAILVSDFGFVEELKCVYDTDSNGKKHLKGVECYLPAYSRAFYEPFMEKDNDGNEYLDIKNMPDDLKEAIGYRIPTEDKYSMVPLIIKGFLPQANGSAIMLPADITVHAGSDFDVDKLFLMLPEFKVYDKFKRRELENDIMNIEGFKKWGRDNIKMTLDMIENGNIAFSEGTPEMAIYDYYEANKDKYFIKNIVEKVNYNHSKSVQDNSRAQRNNLLIDISRSILTNADTVDKFINPGSFDKLKRTARVSDISDNPSLLINWVREMTNSLPNKIDNTVDADKKASLEAKLARVKALDVSNNKGIIDALLNPKALTDSDLQEIAAGEERDPLSPLTFFYYHKQNMTGGALIGMYANNTTLFSKFQSYDQSKVRMNLTYSIEFNGVRFNRLDGIISPHGERISKNCAEFSAASVDNVKDPVLAKLMQNTDTANLTALMLRLGMSVDEIGLLFTQPIIKNWVNEVVGNTVLYEDLKSSLIESLIGQSEELSNYYQALLTNSEVFDKDILRSGFTTRDLVANKLNLDQSLFDQLIYNPGTKADLDRDTEVLLRDQLRILLLMDKLYQSSKQLNKVTKVARADSPNGAMAVSIAGNLIQKARVRALSGLTKRDDWTIEGADIYNSDINAGMTIDALRTKIMNSRFPMLQAFYSLGIDFGQSLMQDYFIQYDPVMVEEVLNLNDICKSDTLTEDQLNKYFREFITYQLSGLDIFGGEEGFNKQRDFYLSQYPARFNALKAAHPELNNIGIIKHITVGRYGLEFNRSARLTGPMRDSFMRDLESLLYRSPLEQQLALDLFVYSYYKDGLYFGPNSFGNFFSTRFLSAIPSFIQGLRDITTNGVQDFTKQFLLNNINDGILPKLPLWKKKEVSIVEEGKKAIVSKKVCTNRKTGSTQPYFIEINDDGYSFLWELQTEGSDAAVYSKIPAPDKAYGARYNKNMTAEELAYFRNGNKETDFFNQASRETPIDFISDVDPMLFEEEDKSINLELRYSESTNQNKTTFC